MTLSWRNISSVLLKSVSRTGKQQRIEHKRDRGSCDVNLGIGTEASTEASTEATAEVGTEATTEANTEAGTEANTKAGIEASTEVIPEAGTEVKLMPEKLSALLTFCRTPKSRQEMMEFCDIKTEKYFRKQIIQPMLKEGLVTRTIPDKPNSPNQKYVTTITEIERAQAIIYNNLVAQHSL